MAFLQVMTGEDEGKKIEFLHDEISIGRADDNSIQVKDPAASAHHCVVIREGNKYTLRDLG
ncbi:MAG: FHA domain-containing protein, partial [Lentisphaerae bacterium]|nr:FHA domain-containing protein [Lentisphaerota bacterium]